MDVKNAIQNRRAYRSLIPVKVTEDLILDLAECAGLAPSCFNKQPWRCVFVHEPDALRRMHEAISQGNDWAKSASMIIAVFSRREDDCIIKEREYHLFDVGMATAFLILRATELGLVAHPIAGYSPGKVSEVLGIPPEYGVITLVMVGKHSDTLSPLLSNNQAEVEKKRPERKPLGEIAFVNRYGRRLGSG